jgi:methylated-DNA-[protein]-cysteine S-methyltransferase
MLAYARHPSPMGTLVLAATERGLVRVGLPVEDHSALLADTARRLETDLAEAPELTADAARELDEYFAGDRRVFELPIDWSLASGGFRRSVLEAMRAIPYGETVSYGELASRAGNARAHRAAGHTCATNPLPVVFPCHRVVRADGHLNWYTGGLSYKRFLLRLEGLWPAGDRVRAGS